MTGEEEKMKDGAEKGDIRRLASAESIIRIATN